MRKLARVKAALPAVIVIAGCASVPPEREERDRLVLAALEPCKWRYSEYFARDAVRVNQDGRVGYFYWDHLVGKVDEVNKCIAEAVKDLKAGPFAPGRLSSNAGTATLPVRISGQVVVLPVRVNGVESLMRLGTNSAVTYVKPAYAKRAGLNVVPESPTAHVRFSGKDVVVPFVRARSVEAGSASVERLDVVVHDHGVLGEKVDGVLGLSFLSLFKVNVDRADKRLTLEPIR